MMPSLRAHNRSTWLVDTTLRDGEQAPGVSFSPPEKMGIASRLASAGVGEIELGTPAMGSQERNAIRAITRMGLRKSLLTVWCRAKVTDLDHAAGCGTAGVHISVPASPRLRAVMRTNCDHVVALVPSLVSRARGDFDFVSIGAQDASRTSLEDLLNLAEVTELAGVDRFRIADTVGIWTPAQVHHVVSSIRQHCPDLHVGFHGHNDLGMATANAVTAIQAGARSADVTVTGIGERAGNARLEEVAVALAMACGRESLADLGMLNDLCRLVAHLSRRALPVDKPIAGENAFRHESGIHVAAMLTDPLSYQPFDAQCVGHAATEYVLGKHSGRAALHHFGERLGVSFTDDAACTLLSRVRKQAVRTRRSLSLADLAAIIREGENR